MELPAQTPPATEPVQAVTPPPVATPAPAPAPVPVQTLTNNSHSQMNYITLSVVLLIVGLAAGAAGGYYVATTLQPAPVVTETSVIPTQDQSAGVNVDTSTTTNPLNGVQTNPFE